MGFGSQPQLVSDFVRNSHDILLTEYHWGQPIFSTLFLIFHIYSCIILSKQLFIMNLLTTLFLSQRKSQIPISCSQQNPKHEHMRGSFQSASACQGKFLRAIPKLVGKLLVFVCECRY